MRVSVFSMMAAVAGHHESPQWEGEIEPPILGFSHKTLAKSTDSVINERLFRLFNRVDRFDAYYLHSAGYKLPSLSPGDFVSWGGKTWRVTTMGFELLTGTDRGAREVFAPYVAA